MCDRGGDLLLGGGHPVAQAALQTSDCGELVGALVAPLLQPHHPGYHPEQHHRPWRRRQHGENKKILTLTFLPRL